MRCLQPNYLITEPAEILSPYKGYSEAKAEKYNRRELAKSDDNDGRPKPQMFFSREEAQREIKTGHMTGRINEVRCRDCATCLMQHARNWAVRMDHESRLYREPHTNEILGEFMCLTYSDEYLPKNGLLPGREDLAFFRERLSDAYPNIKFSWLGCGEYGENTGRAHHHMVLLGKRWEGKHRYDWKGGQSRHPELEEIWPYGIVSTDFIRSGNDAGLYVANYTLKGHEFQVDGRSRRRNQKAAKSRAPAKNLAVLKTDFAKFARAFKADPLNTTLDSEGVYKTKSLPQSWQEIERRTRPFISPQSKPGVGMPWLEKYWPHIYPADYVSIGEGRNRVKVAPPPAYDRWLKKHHPSVHAEVLEKREEHHEDETLSTEQEIGVRSTMHMASKRMKADGARDHE